MARLLLPSWVARPPSHPGEKKYGKFTADQWKTFCMQILPVTLIRLWGSKPADSTERRRLDNFMHLISAVKLATMHRITENQIVKYKFHIRRYLETLVELYPGTSITPYQHLSLHFGHHLRLFGPVHAWQCFPFERFNYVLQQFSTNEKFGESLYWSELVVTLTIDHFNSGEIEKTMFSKFCSTQNIKALYHRDELPEKLHEMIQLYEANYESDFRGTRLSDVFAEDNKFGVVDTDRPWAASDFTPLKDDDFGLLQAWMTKNQPGDKSYGRQVVLRPDIHRYGQRFTDRGRSVDDSQVVFHDEGGAPRVGFILGIFSRASEGGPTEQTWAVIQPYKELAPEETISDHYRSYPTLSACLFRNTWAKSPVLVDVRSIRCHVASCVLEVDNIEGDCRLVLPLNKVGRFHHQDAPIYSQFNPTP
jgi:hypothetical protein